MPSLAVAVSPACLRAASDASLTAETLMPPVIRILTGDPSTIAGGTSDMLLGGPPGDVWGAGAGAAEVAAAVRGRRSTPDTLPST